MEQIYINMLIEWLPIEGDESIRTERVLRLDDERRLVAPIEIYGPKALPIVRGFDELAAALTSNAARVLSRDPYEDIVFVENEIKSSSKRRRDRAWEIIESIVTAEGFQQFDRASRGQCVAEISQHFQVAKKVIYNYLRRYWQGGQSRNALLPAYHKCGGRRGRRLGRSTSESKLGRPSIRSKATGTPIGIRITPEIEHCFEQGIKRFYETRQANTLCRAFQLTLETFFKTGYSYENNVPVPVLPLPEERPTYKQFYYWYETQYRDVGRELKARQGARAFNLDSRAILGESTSRAFGPGSIFEVDATIGDIYLVSSYDRTRIIGRPVIYLVIDLFSHMITGMAVSLEGPSWLSAMLALENVITDKQSFCAEYGVSITKKQWPCHHLGKGLYADRGEFEGYNAEHLINAFSLVLYNSPPYRPDWKPHIERQFGLANESFIHFTPGAVIKKRGRGEKDYRLDASLTLKEFSKLLITHILDYNANHYIKDYPKDQQIVADGVEPFPAQLWDWGISNRPGHLQIVEPRIAMLNFLPRKRISVTSQGLHFGRQLYYTSELVNDWAVRARNRRSWKVEIAYDPRCLDTIYIPLDGGKRMDICYLTPASQQLFKNRDWYETEDYFALQTQEAEQASSRRQQSRASLNAQHKKIIDDAVAETKRAHFLAGPQSKRHRVKSISDNRRRERDAERAQSAWQLEEPNLSVPAAGVSSQHEQDAREAYVPAADHSARLRELRNRKLKKED